MPDPNDPDSYDPNEDDWSINPGKDEYGNPVSRDPNAPDPVGENPYDAALPEQPVDASGLPISTPDTPDNPAPEPIEQMEDGLEDEPPEEEEDPQEEKPPMQPRVTRQQIRLPGAKGPLEVDSIGDYLEDVDWRTIDEAARKAANESYPRNSEPEPPPEPKPEQQQKPKPEPKPRAEQESIKFSSDPPESLGRGPVSEEPIREPAPSIEGMTIEDLEAGQQESSMSGDTQPPQDSQNYSHDAQPPQESQNYSYDATFKHDQIFPTGPPATAEQLNSQKMFSLAHEGPKDSLTHGRGQDQEAIHFAMDKATDAIKTSTGEIVHMLEEMSYVLRQHEYKIRHLMEIVDIEEKRSEY